MKELDSGLPWNDGVYSLRPRFWIAFGVLSAAWIHGPPGPVELPGVDAPFVWARISADRPHSESYYDKERDALSGAYLSPVRCNAVRSSRGSDGSGPRRACLTCLLQAGGRQARRYATTVPQGRMGARVMASGMPGASRRAVLGDATYSVVKVCVRLGGAARPATRQNQRHIPGARPARGCQSWTLCPRVRRRAPSV